MRIYDIIKKKRDGHILDAEEIRYVVEGYTNSVVPDYQMSAFLMAVFLKGMNQSETVSLTYAMAYSGHTISFPGKNADIVDKHSTGGVGDKTTLVSVPIAAACGIKVAKMSGRGLGHTGGTIDKLESIPGFRTDLTETEFINSVERTGLAITGQTGNLVPADKLMYSLRDVTATVDSIPLIASSIMSKKIASGAGKLVLDVKTGRGAFMGKTDEAIRLAEAMVSIGESTGMETVACITSMNSPLGYNIGNSVEVIEAIEVLKGEGSKSLKKLCVEVAALMISIGKNISKIEALSMAEDAIKDGRALSRLKDMISNQGGNPEVVCDYSLLKGSDSEKYEIYSDKTGYIHNIFSDITAHALLTIGGGREKKGDGIDYSAGICLYHEQGSKVYKGEPLAKICAASGVSISKAEELIRQSIIINEAEPEIEPLIIATADSSGVHWH